MSTAKPSPSVPDNSGSRPKKNLIPRIEFEYIQKSTRNLGMAVAAICFLSACLHIRAGIPPWADFLLLAVIWLVLLVSGIGLWLLVSTWKHTHKLPSTAVYSSPNGGARKLDQARMTWSGIARRHNQKRQHWIIVASLLSPVAVLSLSMEILLIPLSNVALALIFFEILVIILALITIYVHWPLGRTHEIWVRARLRAELLRREVYLCRASVGPYLNCSDHEKRAEERIQEITDDRGANPEDELFRLAALLDMEHSPQPDLTRTDACDGAGGSGAFSRPWSDELENSVRRSLLKGEGQAHHNVSEPHFEQHYLTERIQAQKTGYFGIQKELHERLDIIWETLSILTLWLALAMACLHLGLMMSTHNASSLLPVPPYLDIEHWVEVSALTLPPVGGLFIAVRSYLENHRLSRSYNDQYRQLCRLEERLQSVHQGDPEADLEIKRLVLQTEALLSHEIRRWWHIVGPETPKGS